jgi:S1-C subfamily serine protease
MSQQSDRHPGDEHEPQNGPRPPDRLGPRPVLRPSVDPGQADLYRRPDGVRGAFAAPADRPPVQQAPAPPDPEWASAFSRPEGESAVLQRPPRPRRSTENDRGPLWTGMADPWRDPSAGATIGPPALDDDDPEDESATRLPGPRLSLPEVLFGRRVKPMALIVLGVIALVIGAAGGLVGWSLASGSQALTSDVTLAEVRAGKERPAGSIAEIAARVRPAVVSIEVRVDQGGGSGSGVMIDRAGYILTNDHVVTLGGRVLQGGKITTLFTDGTKAEAKLVGRDPKTDLAVIKVEVNDPTVIQLGSSADLQVGDTVVAIGSPLGLTDTVTEGIVSALHRPITASGGNGEPPAVYDAIQTDAAINEGNSGGPLVDSTGALVGVNSSIRPAQGSTGSVGLGFAIPVDDARKVAEDLIRNGRVSHAELGVNAASVSAETAEGARVQNVKDDGAARKAGIQEGDVITRLGDRPVRNAEELTVATRAHEIGETVPVVVVRQGREITIQVTLQSD